METVSEPLARLYELALSTLADQERRADAVRSRLGPVLAAAALGATLLSGPLVGGDRPAGAAGTLALLAAVSGLLITVCGAFSILGSRGTVGLELAPHRLEQELRRDGMLSDPRSFYSAMIVRLDRQSTRNAASLDRLHARFTFMLCGIHVLLCGQALAALIG